MKKDADKKDIKLVVQDVNHNMGTVFVNRKPIKEK